MQVVLNLDDSYALEKHAATPRDVSGYQNPQRGSYATGTQ